MKQFTHYNDHGALVLDFTGDRRWLVEPKGDELHLTPVQGTVTEAGSRPTGEEFAAGRPIVLKFDKPGSLSAIAVGSDRVRNNLEQLATVRAEHAADMAALNEARQKFEKIQAEMAIKYGK